MSKANTVIFVSHGGGPLPVLGDAGHTQMVDALVDIPKLIAKPSAIIVISAHWETGITQVSEGGNPSLIYDYGGFPTEAYRLQYPAPANASLAAKVLERLNAHNIQADLARDRGYDHGVYIPLMLMYPDATIPVIQVSLLNNMDASQHLQIGQALANLEDDNILIVGSGQSFHNLPVFVSQSNAQSVQQNIAFEDWLETVCTDRSLTENQRTQALLKWEQAPFARFCHPREEHLLPLLVCYAAAKRPADKALRFKVMGQYASAFVWNAANR